MNAASKTGINVKGARWKYPDADLLFFRFIRKYALYKGNNVLLFRDQKSTATLNVAINDGRSDGNVGKIGNCFHWK